MASTSYSTHPSTLHSTYPLMRTNSAHFECLKKAYEKNTHYLFWLSVSLFFQKPVSFLLTYYSSFRIHELNVSLADPCVMVTHTLPVSLSPFSYRISIRCKIINCKIINTTCLHSGLDSLGNHSSLWSHPRIFPPTDSNHFLYIGYSHYLEWHGVQSSYRHVAIRDVG